MNGYVTIQMEPLLHPQEPIRFSLLLTVTLPPLAQLPNPSLIMTGSLQT